MKISFCLRFLIISLLVWTTILQAQAPVKMDKTVYLRGNQVGYLSGDQKIFIAFSHQPIPKAKYKIVDAKSGKKVWGPVRMPENSGSYGNYAHHYRLDFSAFQKPGRYKVVIDRYESLPFSIGSSSYNGYHEWLLFYMRQQRCGYNPFLDEVCHKKDGRSMYGPMPDSTYVDVSGGWHDAGDQLRYLMTSGNAVCRLLFSYQENRGKFADSVNYLGQKGSNGIPDILDEAKWGLDWMFKMHPAPDQLFHQVGDDRDHMRGGLAPTDSSDYGWGLNSYRTAYYASGKPQGLGKYQNTSTGIANLCGRYAAAMIMAAAIWEKDLQDPAYAAQCVKAAKEVYQMGVNQPGSQEGTPCREVYRYHEITWADDMEWGAAELYRYTGEPRYLDEAKAYARIINTESWMGKDTARHYEYYPFMHVGHYALYPLVDKAFQDTLAGYYRDGIEKVYRKALQNPYRMGVPFIWCSFNLVTDFITQCILYEQMTGDATYHQFMLENRDWLLGRNPWGISAFIGIPREGGNYPLHPHSPVAWETGREITGGLNDGPVYASIFSGLRGSVLTGEDRYAAFQSDLVVYHDDRGDYSTNEPIMDGTANASFLMAFFARDSIGRTDPPKK
ncbi:MAG: glycoside hydrolase family 9 protein [Candidatus Delongbacteria bacterium]|nr:glycoside hydrolase family 9 protein [Candidatus Delongbacteria bacterium]